MTPLQIVFLFVAALTLVSAGMVVSARRMLHAALWLVLTLLGVAMVFATLESSFFTVVQVIIYVGAIAILIIFAVMLTRYEAQDQAPRMNRFAWLAGIAAAAVFAGLVSAMSVWQQFNAARPEFAGEDVAGLGLALVSPDQFVLPFEVASIMLIGALIGAIFVAGEQRKE
jgi:NADH-quinone oxidoreductase subunit J